MKELRELEDIERQLRQLNVDALSFDHECAEQVKATLVRIAEAAASLCYAIKLKPSRQSGRSQRMQYDADAAMRQTLPRRNATIIKKT